MEDYSVLIRTIGLFFTLSAFFLLSKIKKQNGVLNRGQKAWAIVTMIFSPVLAGAIYYYSLKKIYPTTAKWLNQASFVILGIELLLGVVLIIFASTINTI